MDKPGFQAWSQGICPQRWCCHCTIFSLSGWVTPESWTSCVKPGKKRKISFTISVQVQRNWHLMYFLFRSKFNKNCVFGKIQAILWVNAESAFFYYVRVGDNFTGKIKILFHFHKTYHQWRSHALIHRSLYEVCLFHVFRPHSIVLVALHWRPLPLLFQRLSLECHSHPQRRWGMIFR